MAGKKSPAQAVKDAVHGICKEEAQEVATEAPAAVEPEIVNQDGIFLPKSVAKRIYDLYGKLKEADAHFKTCQATNFREYVRTVLDAPKISEAFESLKSEIKE